MRPLAIVSLLLVLLAGLAVTPTASAAPPQPPCNGTWATTQTVGPVTVFASPPCYEVSVRAMSCPIAGSWKEVVRHAQVVVRAYTCDDPDPSSDAMQSQPCTCPPPQCPPIDTVGKVADFARVTVDQWCNVRVDLLSNVACTSPFDERNVIQRGRVTVTAPCEPKLDPCEPPMECYPEASPVLIPPVCIWKEVEQGPLTVGFDQCRQDHEDNTCSNGSPQRIHRYEQVGPVYAQVHVCFPHSPPPDATAMESNPCGSAGLTPSLEIEPMQSCPAPVPLCAGLSEGLPFAIDQPELPVASASPVPYEVRYEIAENCHVDVYVKVDVMDCLWGEGYNRFRDVGPVTVWTWGCRPYPPTEVAQEAPPCTCPPPQPMCYQVNRVIAWGDQVWVDDSCNVTVDLKADCGLQGYDQHEERQGKVTVRYQTCRQPEQW